MFVLLMIHEAMKPEVRQNAHPITRIPIISRSVCQRRSNGRSGRARLAAAASIRRLSMSGMKMSVDFATTMVRRSPIQMKG